jgi:DNA-binding transcriptional ArsR family regulator
MRMGHRGNGHPVTSGALDARMAKQVARTMQALATPSRLLILARLREGPATVGELTEHIDMEQSAVSHQLRLLRDTGLVEGERHGRSIVYRLFDDHVAELLDQAVFHSEHLRLAGVAGADRVEGRTVDA